MSRDLENVRLVESIIAALQKALNQFAQTSTT